VTRPGVLLAVLAALAVSLGGPREASAELSAEDYGGSRATRPEPDRSRAQALIEAARRREAEQEAERERARQAEEIRQRAEEAEREARRPLGERLTARYCVPCHGPERIAAARHTRLGWSFTVGRMRTLNRAPIPAAEARTIATHLAVTQPAGLVRTLGEYGLALALLLAPVAWMLRRRVQATRRGGAKSARTTQDLKTESSR
jgi:hypothetical protein